MSDDFDLDGLLDEVLNSTVPSSGSRSVQPMYGQSVDVPVTTPVQPSPKYHALSVLPESLESEWSRTIEIDEAVMKLQTPQKLSNAYTNTKGHIHASTLKDYFIETSREGFGSDEKMEGVIKTMSEDPHVLSLFRDDMKQKIRTMVSKADHDLCVGDFKALKSLLQM